VFRMSLAGFRQLSFEGYALGRTGSSVPIVKDRPVLRLNARTPMTPQYVGRAIVEKAELRLFQLPIP